MKPIKAILTDFAAPGIPFRSIPFWAWNDKLDPNELIRQSDALKEGGMGGYFMHSREGLETSYLGEEWMDCIRQTVSHAAETGMEAWLYDEDKWPSGTAGGRVTENPAYRARALTIELTDRLPEDDTVVRIFLLERDGNTLHTARKMSPNSVEVGREYAVFRLETAPICEWFNNQAAADNLNPECVHLFIEKAYEPYKTVVGSQFGKAVPGIFTDEPNIADSNNTYSGRGWIPWSDGMDAYFFSLFGYCFLDVLVWMFFDGPLSFPTRHDFWYAISRRFTSAYTAQISSWCRQNGLTFTGHFLFESDWGWGTRSGGAVMPHYRYEDIPAIDMLCNNIHETLTVKQCTSVANQLGRETVLSEMYAATGWEFTYEDQKQIGDWQYVLGINRRSQHLALASLRGCRKRDYPPSFNYNNCAFRYNRAAEDYFARIAAVMRPGKAVRDLLVLHPQSTVWGRLGADVEDRGLFEDQTAAAANRQADRFNAFCERLLALHYDFDLGDEQLMAELAHPEEKVMVVGQCRYPVILLTGCETLLASTAALLSEFLDKGGRLIAVGTFPNRVDGRLSDLVLPLKYHPNTLLIVEDQLNTALEDILPRRIDIRSQNRCPLENIWYLLKENDGCLGLFLSNNSKTEGYTASVSLSYCGHVAELDPLTGTRQELTVEKTADGMRFIAQFPPNGSRLYLIDLTAAPQIAPQSLPVRSVHLFAAKQVYAVCTEPESFTRSHPNVLVLDRCRYAIGDAAPSEEMELWRAQQQIRETLGMRQVFYNGLLQRYHWVDTPHPKDGTPVTLTFTFQVEELPQTPVYLVTETPSYFKISLNDRLIPTDDCGWYLDRSFRKIRLDGLQKGLNQFTLSCGYRGKMELEDCFLIGDFALSPDFCLIREPKMLRLGDWCLQGYPFYSGSMTYQYRFDCFPDPKNRALLRLGHTEATVIAVRINGKTAGCIPWKAANNLDLTPYLLPGDNTMELEVMGSQRNTLGPLHLSKQVMEMTNWCSFRSEGVLYSKAPVLLPYGLMEPPVIYQEN